MMLEHLLVRRHRLKPYHSPIPTVLTPEESRCLAGRVNDDIRRLRREEKNKAYTELCKQRVAIGRIERKRDDWEDLA